MYLSIVRYCKQVFFLKNIIMSSNTRPTTNVGVGSLREPDEEQFTINEGWDFFQKHAPDESVVANEPFSFDASNLESTGPYRIEIPEYIGKYLNPSSLRLNGTCRLIYTQNGVPAQTLPTLAIAYNDPNGHKESLFDLVAKTNAEKTALATKDATTIVNTDGLLPIITDVAVTIGENNDATVALTKEYVQLEHKVDLVAPNTQPLVIPENQMCQAMWKEIKIILNGAEISKSANLEYAHRARFQTLLSYSDDALQTHLKSELWYPDNDYEIEQMHELEKLKPVAERSLHPFEDNYNKSKCYHDKANLFGHNKDFSFSMQLHTELTSIHSFMPDRIKYEFTFSRNDPSIYLRSFTNANFDGGKYDIKFSKLSLSGEFMIPSPKIYNQIKTYLNNNEAVLRTCRTEITRNTISNGYSSFDWTNMFTQNTLPDQIFVAMVSQEAKEGSYSKDAFYFHHYNVNSIRLQVNNKNLPVETLTPDFENDNYTRTYKALYENMAIKNANCGLSITPHNFKWGNTIFAWDLNPDSCAGAHSNHTRSYGAASLHLTFKKPLPEQVSLICVAVYRDYLVLSPTRQYLPVSGHGYADITKM